MTLYLLKDGAQNFSNYNNDEVDAMVRKLPDCKDLEEREALLHEIQKIHNDDVNIVPVYYETQITATKSNVEGLVVYPNELIRLAYLTRT